MGAGGERLDHRRLGQIEQRVDRDQPFGRGDKVVAHCAVERADAADDGQLLAEVVAAGAAVDTLATDDIRLEHDAVADLDVCGALAERLDGADNFMTGHDRQGDEWMLAVVGVQIRAADPDLLAADEGIARSRGGFRRVPHHDRLRALQYDLPHQ